MAAPLIQLGLWRDALIPQTCVCYFSTSRDWLVTPVYDVAYPFSTITIFHTWRIDRLLQAKQ